MTNTFPTSDTVPPLRSTRKSDRAVPRSEPAFVRSNGVELCYDTFGDKSAPPLLLIMGVASQMIVWDDEFCAELARRGYWVIRFDNRDIGMSTRLTHLGIPNLARLTIARALRRPVKAPYLLLDMANDTVGLMDALGIGSAHIVGASMGGAIAQEIAIHYPQRIRTLTLIMASTGDPGLPRPKLQALLPLIVPARTSKAAYVRRYQRTWRILRAGRFPLDEARDVERAEATFARGLNPAGAVRQLAAIIASPARGNALKRVAIPTLVIHGDADPLVPVGCGIDIARKIPGAKQLIIQGMGHALPISMWDQMIDAIAQHAVSLQ